MHPRSCFLIVKESVLIVIRHNKDLHHRTEGIPVLAALGNGNKALELSYAEICMEKAAAFLLFVCNKHGVMEPLLHFYILWFLMGTVLIIYKTRNDSGLT